MIEVQLKDIVDVLLNIPNAIYTFYFHTKVCNIKNKKAYIIILTLCMSVLTFLQNTELIGHELHVVLAFLACVFMVQLFIRVRSTSIHFLPVSVPYFGRGGVLCHWVCGISCPAYPDC